MKKILDTAQEPGNPSADEGEGLELFRNWVSDPKDMHTGSTIVLFPCKAVGKDRMHTLRRVARPEMGEGASDFEAWIAKRRMLRGRCVPKFIHAGATSAYFYIVEGTGRGQSMMKRVRAAKGSRGRRIRALRAIYAAGKTLEMSAEMGLFHGDLHPSRDLMYYKSNFKVLGIGAVQAFGHGNIDTGNEFAAPERRAGKSFDHRADIYSLGAILAKCLTGKTASAEEPFRAPKHLFWGFTYVIDLAMMKDPANRFETWDIFLQALRRCLDHYASLRIKNVTTRRAARTTSRGFFYSEEMPAVTPANSEGSSPSSSDPTPSPTPQKRYSLDLSEMPEPPIEHGAKSGRGGRSTKAANDQEIEIQRITLPSPAFTTAPANLGQAARWFGSRFGFAVAAAAFGLLWWSRGPELDSTTPTPETAPAIELSGVLWPISSAQGSPSVEREPAQAQAPAFARNERRHAREANACDVSFCVKGGEEPKDPGRQ